MKQKIKTGILMTALAVGSLHIVNRCAQAFATVKNLLDKHKGAFYDWRFGQVYIQKQEAVLLSCLFTIWLRLPLPTNGICC